MGTKCLFEEWERNVCESTEGTSRYSVGEMFRGGNICIYLDSGGM